MMNLSLADFVAVGGLFLTLLAVIVFPVVALLIRNVTRLAKIEHNLSTVMSDVKEVVEDSKTVHDGFNRRLRWVEENLWQRRKGANNAL